MPIQLQKVQRLKRKKRTWRHNKIRARAHISNDIHRILFWHLQCFLGRMGVRLRIDLLGTADIWSWQCCTFLFLFQLSYTKVTFFTALQRNLSYQCQQNWQKDIGLREIPSKMSQITAVFRMAQSLTQADYQNLIQNGKNNRNRPRNNKFLCFGHGG